MANKQSIEKIERMQTYVREQLKTVSGLMLPTAYEQGKLAVLLDMDYNINVIKTDGRLRPKPSRAMRSKEPL